MLTEEQLKKAASYNSRRMGPDSYQPCDLPWPFCLYSESSTELAIHAAAHQMYEGLGVDGMIGPTTLESIMTTAALGEPEDQRAIPGVGGAALEMA